VVICFNIGEGRREQAFEYPAHKVKSRLWAENTRRKLGSLRGEKVEWKEFAHEDARGLRRQAKEDPNSGREIAGASPDFVTTLIKEDKVL